MSVSPIRNFGGAPAHVTIVGGGVGGLEAMLAIRALARERVSIDLIEPQREFVYRPLSVLEPFDGEAPRFDLTEIAMDQGARHHRDRVVAVDPERRRVRLAGGGEVAYDALVVAIGAKHSVAIEGALTFGGPDDTERFAAILREAELGTAPRLLFAVPPGVVWALPLYELALNTAAYLAVRDVQGVELTLVTPEDAPLALFGPQASETVRGLLEDRGVRIRTGSYPVAIENGRVTLVPHGHVDADRVVALPRLEGPNVPGLPQDEGGFVAIDEHCLVHGLENVYAVGDMTAFPIKQGGITAEQAVAAAEAIASRAGAPVEPRPFRPVLRGLLLTGGEPRYLSANITRGPAIESEADVEPLWWPPSKIPGRYIASYLREKGRAHAEPAHPPASAAVPFEVELGARPAPGAERANGKRE